MSTETPEFEIERPVSKPAKPLPAGSWDCHTHVLGPFDKYPLKDNIGYEPPLATSDDYIGMLDAAGFEHGVPVHAGACGWDNSATSDAVSSHWPRLRAIGVLPADTSIEELARYHEKGMRGMRINNLPSPPFPPLGGPGVLGPDAIDTLAPKFRELGWHFNVFSVPALTFAMLDKLTSSKVPVIFDHMALVNIKGGVDSEEFQKLLAVMADNNFYVKMTISRVLGTHPLYEDVRPYFEEFLKRIPDQVVFGSDWPFIGQGNMYPDVGKMVDVIDSWMGDETLRNKLFVSNPATFYGDK